MIKHLLNILVLILAGMCLATPLFAETYSWTDENGTMNFTENYSSIPLKYRKKTLKREEIEYSKPLTTDVTPISKDINGGNTQSEKQINVLSKQSKAEPKGMFGGKRGQEWSSEFRAKELEISILAQKIRQAEELLNKPTGLNKDQINRLPQEIVSLVTQRNEAIKRFNVLNDSANSAGVPAEFRK
jgi:hypothetical protein